MWPRDCCGCAIIEPEVLKQTWKFVQVNGYINYRLTGRVAMDPAHAVLLQMRNYSTGAWSEALCSACGVEPEQFPEVMEGHKIQGEVTAEAAEASGLRAGTPVMAGTVDSPAAALEAGVAEPGIAVEMTGTSTVVIIPNDRGLTEPALIALPHALPGMHLLLGAMVSSGGCLRWFRDQFGQAENQAATEGGADSYDLLTRQAAGIEPGSGGVIFLPYMMGERSPLWHSNARGVFFGLSLATPRAALVRAILEGTAFALRHNVETAMTRRGRGAGDAQRGRMQPQRPVEPDQGGRSGASGAAAAHFGRLSVWGCHCGGNGSGRLSQRARVATGDGASGAAV